MTVSTDFHALVGRLLLGWFFLSQANLRVGQWDAMLLLVQMRHIPLGATLLSLSLVTMLLGGAGIILGWQARLCAAALTLCTLAWVVCAHDFWNLQNAIDRTGDFETFSLGLGLVGGLLLLTGFGPGRFSMDAWTARSAQRENA